MKPSWIAATTALLTKAAQACPFCNEPTGIAVNQAIFDGAFICNVVTLAAPFLVLGAIVAGLYAGGSRHDSS